MENKDFKIHSTNENLRLCIIENAIFIEELISNAIGTVLNIDWENSKSFGFSSSSLSFNQKIQIIQDIKGLDKELIKKFTCLTNVRNKFAHISSVDSFDKLFSISKNGNEIKKQLNNWYGDRFNNDSPEYYRYCFYSLIEDIIGFIFNMAGEHMYELGYKKGYNEGKELYSKLLTEEVKKLPNNEVIFELVLKKMDELKNEGN